MSFSIQLTSRFEKEAKKLFKKYPSLKNEIIDLRNELKENPETGSPIGHNCYKIRIAISSKGKGKRGGARVITYLYIKGKTIYLLSLFDKSEKETISDKELIEILKEIPK